MTLINNDFNITEYLLFHLRIHSFRNLYFKFRNLAVARFLVFHDLQSDSARQFENNILVLKKYSNIITLDDFINRRLSYDKTNLVITFDDGYKSWIEIVLPILKKHKIIATFFICSGRVRHNNYKKFNYKFSNSEYNKNPNSSEYLTVKDLIRIRREGHIIGGHTKNHVSMKRIKNLYVIKKEIFEDKVTLEEILGEKINYFAYPFGDIDDTNSELKNILMNYGYKAAVTLKPGFNTEYKDKYYLHRDIVRGGMNTFMFLSRSLGDIDLKLFLIKLLKGIFLLREYK